MVTEREPARVVYEFGEFRLDPQRQTLVDDKGSAVALTPRAFELLTFFLEHHQHLLDKSTLMKAVWPSVVVEDNTLSQHLSAVRRALGDGQHNQRYIITIPGRGYRFVAEVRRRTVEGVTSAPVARETKQTATDRSAPAMPSVAVLPFINLSADPAKEYFADGMAEELIHLLARVPELRVPARTSSFAYKGTNLDARDIARELGVAAVLEGSVRSADDRVRVTVQLVDATTGYHFWSQTYEREFRDIFTLQDEIASAIVELLCAKMGVACPPLTERAPPTDDVAAYELYLQGLAMGYLATAQSLQRGIELLKRATDLDPKFAAAFAAIAVMDLNLSMWGLPDAVNQAEHAADTALALDPQRGDAHQALACVSARRGAWLRAEGHYRAARELAHRSDMLDWHIAHLPASVGHVRSTLRQLVECYRAAPAVPVIPSLLAAASLALPLSENATQQALDYADLAVDLGMPGAAGPLPVVRAYGALRLGRVNEVIGAAQDLAGRLPAALTRAGGGEMVTAVHSALAGHISSSSAAQALDTSVSAVTPEQIGPELSVHVLSWYTMLGKLDGAYGFADRVLQDALPRRILGLFLPWIWLPELLPFRRDARFQTVIAQLRLVDYWKTFGPPDGCDLHGETLVVG